MVSFRSFTLFVYARFLRRQSLIVVVGVVVRALLLIHYFIVLVVLKYRRTLFKRSSL